MKMRYSPPLRATFEDDFMALWPEVEPLPQHKAADHKVSEAKPVTINVFYYARVRSKSLVDCA